jgi:uncharacterized membrane protein YfcA
MAHIDLLNLSMASVASICVMLLIAGATKGLIGIGMPIIAVPLLNLVVDLPATVALLSIPLIIANLPQAFTGEKASAVLSRLLPLLCGLALGIVGGVYLLTSVRADLLKGVVGIILIGIVFLMFFAPHFTVPKEQEKFLGPLVGMIGGVLGGLAALPGPLVFVYILALGFSNDRFVQYSSMFLVIAATLMAITLGSIGALGWVDLLGSILAAVPIFIGMKFGTRLRTFVSPSLFRRIILGVVMISGIHMISGPVTVSIASVLHQSTSR